jgi:hypothetical protein
MRLWEFIVELGGAAVWPLAGYSIPVWEPCTSRSPVARRNGAEHAIGTVNAWAQPPRSPDGVIS